MQRRSFIGWILAAIAALIGWKPRAIGADVPFGDPRRPAGATGEFIGTIELDGEQHHFFDAGPSEIRNEWRIALSHRGRMRYRTTERSRETHTFFVDFLKIGDDYVFDGRNSRMMMV